MPIQPSKKFTPPVSRGGGFSGTVANPSSVTVGKGLVTHIATGTASGTGGGTAPSTTATSFQVLVDANDSTPGFLSAKIVSGGIFTWTVNNSPGNETYTVGLAAQAANTVLAGPTSGGSATPTYRLLVPADLPVATTGSLGAVEPDGTTITISAGVISAVNQSLKRRYVAYFESPPTLFSGSDDLSQVWEMPYGEGNNSITWVPQRIVLYCSLVASGPQTESAQVYMNSAPGNSGSPSALSNLISLTASAAATSIATTFAAGSIASGEFIYANWTNNLSMSDTWLKIEFQASNANN